MPKIEFQPIREPYMHGVEANAADIHVQVVLAYTSDWRIFGTVNGRTIMPCPEVRDTYPTRQSALADARRILRDEIQVKVWPFELEPFFRAYLECAVWSSTEDSEDGRVSIPLDTHYGPDNIPYRCKEKLRAECVDFIRANASDLADIDAKQAGHDFWLTRNGHGTGFWDRGLGEVGERLTDAAHAYGSVDLYVGDDGKVWASGYED